MGNFVPHNSKAMFDLISKLGGLKAKMDAVKSILDDLRVSGESGASEVKVTVTGNRKVVSVHIEPHLLFPEKKEQVEELLEIALNRALQEAEKRAEEEMKAAGRELLPGFPL